MNIGLISDTHGLMRPEALAALAGSERILHAGDIGAGEVLRALEAIAPVTAIRGNNDTDVWARELSEIETVDVGGTRLYLLHNLKTLAIDPQAAGAHVVISGHSHKPLIEHRDGVLFVNPGSAGPRRFKLPISVARLLIRQNRVEAEIIVLDR